MLLSPRRKFRPNLACDPGEETTCNPKESGAVAFRLTHSKNANPPNQACKLLIFRGIFLSAILRPKTTDTQTTEAIIHVAMIRLTIRRLAV
jgi:hypothetical protein